MSMTDEALRSALKKVEAQQENLGGFMDRFNVEEHWAVRKALEEIQQYRAIGTVEELQDMKNKYQEAVVDWRQYRKIGTIEEFKALKEKERADKAMNNSTWGANKEISVNWD